MDNIKINYTEKEKFQKAFRQHEFRALFDEYFDEISDEKYRKEKEEHLLSLYFKGELKNDKILIQPNESFCVRTKIIYSNQTSQKLFLNICVHEGILDISTRDIAQGYVNIPYSLSQIRPDKCENGKGCLTIDCCLNNSTLDFIRNFRDMLTFLLEDVSRNIEKNIFRDKEKICRDYKILRNIKCKGGTPYLLCINKSSIKENVLIKEEKKLEILKEEYENKIGENEAYDNEKNIKALSKCKTETDIKLNQLYEGNNFKNETNEINELSEIKQKGEINEQEKKYKKEKTERVMIYHQGIINVSSLFLKGKYENVSLNLPNKIKVLVNLKTDILKKDIHIQVKEKKLSIKFSNAEEEDVQVHLPYPCDSNSYSCFLKNDKHKLELYLNLCNEFVKSKILSLQHEKQNEEKEETEEKTDVLNVNGNEDTTSDPFDYIDEVVKNYEEAKEREYAKEQHEKERIREEREIEGKKEENEIDLEKGKKEENKIELEKGEKEENEIEKKIDTNMNDQNLKLSNESLKINCTKNIFYFNMNEKNNSFNNENSEEAREEKKTINSIKNVKITNIADDNNNNNNNSNNNIYIKEERKSNENIIYSDLQNVETVDTVPDVVSTKQNPIDRIPLCEVVEDKNKNIIKQNENENENEKKKNNNKSNKRISVSKELKINDEFFYKCPDLSKQLKNPPVDMSLLWAIYL